MLVDRHSESGDFLPRQADAGGVSWAQAAAVILAVAAIVAVAAVCASAAAYGFDRWTGLGSPRAYRPGELEDLTTARLAMFLIAFQLTSVVLGLAVGAIVQATTRAPDGATASLLSFRKPRGGWRTLATSVALLLLLATGYGAAIFLHDPASMVHDVGPFAGLVRTNSWWLIVLAAAIGAPIAEELVFRGVLFGALRASPAGPVLAALVSATMWASLHVSYSIYGLAAIFLIGLYLARVRQTTGSLLAPIACHGFYNAAIILALMSVP
ncbi:MAG: CPBP family intramembrane metalloprotease [Hyphomicrobium sp.]|nr:CPBP family intramembrane metalloprotease [Hyphomicrobium sp.]